jgi:hypothetical protein
MSEHNSCNILCVGQKTDYRQRFIYSSAMASALYQKELIIVCGDLQFGEPAHKCNHMMHLTGKRGGESSVCPKVSPQQNDSGSPQSQHKTLSHLDLYKKKVVEYRVRTKSFTIRGIEIKVLQGFLSNRYRDIAQCGRCFRRRGTARLGGNSLPVTF